MLDLHILESDGSLLYAYTVLIQDHLLEARISPDSQEPQIRENTFEFMVSIWWLKSHCVVFACNSAAKSG